MRKALMVFSVILAICVVALLAWANWPVPKEVQTSQLHLVAPDAWSAEDIAKVHAIMFDYTILYPSSMKAGQVGKYQVIFTGLPDSIQVAGQTWQVHIHSELLMPGFLNLSEGMISQAVQVGTPLRSTWDVKAIDERNSEGILRTYVEYVAPLASIEPQLLSVTDLALTSSNLFGLSTGGVNSLAVAFLLLSGLAGSLGLTRPHG